MATTYQKQQARRRRGKKTKQESTANRVLWIGVGALVLGLLAFGMIGVLGRADEDRVNLAAVTVDQAVSAVENVVESVDQTTNPDGPTATDVDSGAEGANVAEPSHQEAATGEQVTAVDRETRFLGAPSDPASLALAEAGDLGQPTLVWFHADWCHVCQRVKPDVVNLGEQYDGQVKFVRLNVDHGESREAVRRYGVRATPTFVLIDAEGQLRGQVPGWPGYQAFTSAFDQLLAGG